MWMSCRRLARELTDAREGRLSAWAALRHRVHLRLCPACRAYVRGFEQVEAALRDLPKEEPAAELCEALKQRLRGRSRSGG